MLYSLCKIAKSENRKRSACSSSSSLSYGHLEARQLLTTFFVDAAAGNDSNPGTADLPFATYLPVVWAYDQPEGSNIGTVQLQAGDELVFREGTYNATFQNPSDRNTGTHRGLYLRGLSGTEDNPIIVRAEPGVVINPTPPDNSEHFSVEIIQSEHIDFQGFEITGKGTGVFVAGSSNIDIHNLWVHHIEGAAIDNLSAVMLSGNSGDIRVYDSIFNDVFDQDNRASENTRFVVAFSNTGANVEIFNNTLFSSEEEYSSGGIVTKHGSDSFFNVHHNIISGTRNESVGSGNLRNEFTNNLILQSAGISFRDFGGPSFFEDSVVENNSFIESDGALSYNPTDTWYPLGIYEDIGTLRFTGNLIEDAGRINFEDGTLQFGPYTTGDLAAEILSPGSLVIDENIYSHTSEQFYAKLFPGVSGFQRDLTFEQWQADGFDINGHELQQDIVDGLFRPQSQLASSAGWLAGEDLRLTLFALDANGEVVIAPQVSEGDSQTFSLIRSGNDLASLNEALTVTLSTSDAGQLSLPTTVTFQPGQTELQFEAVVLNDGIEERESALRISADAAGTEYNVDAWVRILDSGVNEIVPEQGELPEPPIEEPQSEEAPPVSETPVDNNEDQAGFVNGLLTLPGGASNTASLNFNWVERFAAFDNEIGLFVVEDSQGTVDGLRPSDPGYSAAALSGSSRQVIFQSGLGAGESNRIQLQGGSKVGFYLIQNATTDEFLRNNPSNQPNQNPLAFFSIVDANPDQFDHLNTTSMGENQWQLGWEDLFNGGDLSFTDAVIELQIEEVASEAEVDRLAQQLRIDLGLRPEQFDFFNWGGMEERWIRGNDNWYFIKPNGELFAWKSGVVNNVTGDLIAQLDHRYHDNIFLFNNTESINTSPEIQLPSLIDGETVDLVFGEELQFVVVVDDDQPITEQQFDITINGQAATSNGPSIDQDGLFSWTPADAGEYAIEITTRDPSGLSDSEVFSVNVVENQIEVVLVQEDFEDGSLNGFDGVAASGAGTWRIVDEGLSEDSDQAIEITFPEPESGASAAVYDLQDASRVDVSYSVRLPEGITTANSGSTYASVNQSRVWSATSGELGLSASLQYFQDDVDSPGRWQYQFLYGVDGLNTRFHNIAVDSPDSEFLNVRYSIQWNTAGNEDGVFQAWINDELVVNEHDVVWSLGNSLPEGASVGGYYSGPATTTPFRQLTDEIQISASVQT